MTSMNASSRQPRTMIRRPAAGVDIDPDLLRYYREAMGWSRQDLADEIIMPKTGRPMSVDALAKLENGDRRPRPYLLELIAKALQIKPVRLLPAPPAAEDDGA